MGDTCDELLFSVFWVPVYNMQALKLALRSIFCNVFIPLRTVRRLHKSQIVKHGCEHRIHSNQMDTDTFSRDNN